MYVASCYARVKHNSGVLHVFLLNTIILSNLFNTSFLIKFSFIWRYKFISPSWLILYYCKCLFKNIWIEVSPFPYVLAIQQLGIYSIYCTHSSLCMFHRLLVCRTCRHVQQPTLQWRALGSALTLKMGFLFNHISISDASYNIVKTLFEISYDAVTSGSKRIHEKQL